jgi:hypothetical protein
LSLAHSDLGTTTLSLSWSRPDSNGSSITDYRVEVSSNGGSRWTAIPHTASSSTTFNVSNLAKGTAYKFRVAAVNGIGTSAASNVIDVTTPTTLPAAPTSLAAGSVAQRTASLSWRAPTDTGGSPITNYLVEYSTNAGESWTTVVRSISTSTRTNLTGLTPGTSYRFRVSSVTAIGTSETGATVDFTTLSAPVNTAAPSVTGTATVGSLLSASSGTWTGTPSPTYAYAWLLCGAEQLAPRAGGIAPSGCTPIRGATAATYTLVTSQLGKWILVRVTARNASGTAIYYSASTSAIGSP